MKKKLFMSFVLFMGLLLLVTGCGKTYTTDNYNVDDMISLIDTVYQNVDSDMPKVESLTVDCNDSSAVTIYSGIKNNDKIEYLVESEPVDSSVPYSFVLVKAKDSSSVKNLEKEIIENLNMNRWSENKATNLYVNSYGKIIAIIVGNDSYEKNVYQAFKTIAANEIGIEYTKVNE